MWWVTVSIRLPLKLVGELLLQGMGSVLFHTEATCQSAKGQRQANKVITSHKSRREHSHGRNFKWWGMCSAGTRTHCALLGDGKWFVGPLGEKVNELSN